MSTTAVHYTFEYQTPEGWGRQNSKDWVPDQRKHDLDWVKAAAEEYALYSKQKFRMIKITTTFKEEIID